MNAKKRSQEPVWELDQPAASVKVTGPEPIYCTRMTKRMNRIDSKLLAIARGVADEAPPPTRPAPPPLPVDPGDPFGGLILVEGEPILVEGAPPSGGPLSAGTTLACEPLPFSKPIDRT